MLLTVKQFADQQKALLSKIYRHIKAGILPYVQIGNTYLIELDKLPEYKQQLTKLEEKKKNLARHATKISIDRFAKSGKRYKDKPGGNFKKTEK